MKKYIRRKQEYRYFLSIIIPMYNEEKRIKKTILDIQKKLKHIQYEILLIDDGSTDNTKKIVSSFLNKNKNIHYIFLQKNTGKGFAIKIGFLHAHGKHVLMIDADLSTPIETIFDIKDEIEQYDIIIGSRIIHSKKTVIQGPISRILLRKLSIILRKTLFDIQISDTQCGFKIFTNNAAKNIAQKITVHRYGADVEKLIIAKYLGYSIKEIPVSWIYDEKYSKINPIRDSFLTMLEWLKIRINMYKKFY